MNFPASDRERVVGAHGDGLTPSGAPAANGGAARGRARKQVKKQTESAKLDAQTIARLFARTGKLTKQERLAAAQAVRGDWKDRPEWKGMSSIEIAAELRRRAFSRGRNG
jgi:hypothetical protein